MSELQKKISRRDFLKALEITAGAALLASCAPATASPAPTQAVGQPTAVPTVEPTATTAPAAPTATTAAATTLNWDIYPRSDPRHWIVAKAIDPAKKYDNLSIATNYNTNMVNFKQNEDTENNPVTHFLKETTGVSFKATWANPDPNAPWGPALASGGLPDLMVQIPSSPYSQLLEQNMLEDITDIWEKNASPLVKKMKEYPNGYYWAYSRVKGRIYSIPAFWGPTGAGDDQMWYRKDWLDKLKLPIPDTIDQVYETGKAFMDAGLAKIGICVGADFGNMEVPMWGSLAVVFGGHGYVPCIWQKGEDGKLFYSSTHPTQKDALAVLQKWYKEGFIESDYMKRRGQDPSIAMGEDCISGRAGIMPAPYFAIEWSLITTKDTFPEADWVWGDIPAGPGGKRGRFHFPDHGLVFAFKKGTDPTIIEAILNQINFCWDIIDASRIAWYPFWEGYDYIIDDQGKCQLAANSTLPMSAGGFEYTSWHSPLWFGNMFGSRIEALIKADPEGKTWNPVEAFRCDDPKGINVKQRECYKRTYDTFNWGQMSEFYYPEPPSVAQAYAVLKPMEDEAYVRIITGQDPVSAWDTWVGNWKKQGGDRMTNEINDAYASYQAG